MTDTIDQTADRSWTADTKPSTDRARLRRLHQRGHYDFDSIARVLDATSQCSVGYVFKGMPYVTPTLHWREGDHIYWHGSSASRMLKATEGADVCLSVAILDGYVMARSGMHHSVNSRSAMLFGKAHKITDPDEKEAKLKAFVEGLFPGRWDTLRPVSALELKATTILGMPIDEASAKVRSGQPGDDEEDYALPIWSGVIPVRTEILPPIPDPRNLEGVIPPAHITEFGKNRDPDAPS